MSKFLTKEELFNRLHNETRVLTGKQLQEAFWRIDRKDFVRPELYDEAYEDYALPIGFGQTISQPTTVFFMLELLDVKPGHKVLDIGSGSGWTTALLAVLVGEKGSVLGLEIVAELIAYGQRNLRAYNFRNAEIQNAVDKISRPEEFDRILVSAAAAEMPAQIMSRLKRGGVMVVPIKESIFKIEKGEDASLLSQEFPGFAFVPLVQ